MMRDALLALGVALSSATQLRIPGLPLGFGDLCIALWIIICLFDVLAGRAMPQVAALLRLIAFWLLFAFALSVGALIGFMTEHQVWLELTMHDTIAYFLMATLSCLAVATIDAPGRLRRMAWFLMLFAGAGIAVQIAAGWNIITIPLIDPWYWDRFRGWSENPNQLAINCCILTLIAVHLAATSSGYWRILGLLAVIAPLVAGRLSKSDTFISVTIFSCVLLFALHLRHLLTTAAYRSKLRYAFLVVGLIFLVPILVSLLPFAKAGANDAESFALSLAKDKGGEASERTLDLRLRLWEEAASLGVSSGGFGLGPGPHLSPPPHARPTKQPFEAHNTPLDIFLQSGVIGLTALVGFILTTAFLLYQTQQNSLLTLIIAISIFSSAHLIIRHPIVWFALTLCVSTGCAHARLAPAQSMRV